MRWYYHIVGGHTHVRVFMNGAKCGDLCFRNEEWQQLTTCHNPEDFQELECKFVVRCIREGSPAERMADME